MLQAGASGGGGGGGGGGGESVETISVNKTEYVVPSGR
jgi:hypothetical protein